MIFSDLIKCVFSFILAFLYFKYLDEPLFNKSKEDKLKKEGHSKKLIDGINLSDNVRDFKGKIGGYGLIIVGLMFFFKFVKNNFF